MARRKKLHPAIDAHMGPGGPEPLDVLQGLMRMHLASGNFELAGRYAIEAAPYRHAKALAVAVNQGDLFSEVTYRWAEPEAPRLPNAIAMLAAESSRDAAAPQPVDVGALRTPQAAAEVEGAAKPETLWSVHPERESL